MRTMNTKFDRFLLISTSIGILLFWLIFFLTFDMQPSTAFALHQPCWLKWELSFPVADAFLAIVALWAFILHLRGKSSAFKLQAAAGGGAIFLAFIDATFFLENSLYVGKDGVIEAGIHIYLLFAGTYLIWSALKNGQEVER